MQQKSQQARFKQQQEQHKKTENLIKNDFVGATSSIWEHQKQQKPKKMQQCWQEVQHEQSQKLENYTRKY